MNMRTHTIGILTALSLAAFAQGAHAQIGGRDHGFYLGLRFLGSSLHVDDDQADFFVKDDGGGAVLMAGYSFNDVFSLEIDAGGDRHDTSDPAVDAQMGVLQLFAHYRFAPGSAFRPYIKGGVGGYVLVLDGPGPTVSAEGGGVPIGGGFDYFFSPHFSLGADFTHNIIQYEKLHVDFGGTDVAFDIDEEGALSSLGLSVSYYF